MSERSVYVEKRRSVKGRIAEIHKKFSLFMDWGTTEYVVNCHKKLWRAIVSATQRF